MISHLLMEPRPPFVLSGLIVGNDPVFRSDVLIIFLTDQIDVRSLLFRFRKGLK